jgi:hypothetical protein
MTYLPQNKIKEYRDANKPSRCPILSIRTSDWVLDHDHQTGMVRGVISRQANSLLGKIENFFLNRCAGRKQDLPAVLDALADYLRKPQTDVLHPVGLTQLCKRFSRLTKDKQAFELMALGCTRDEIALCSNSKERTQIYRKVIKNGT